MSSKTQIRKIMSSERQTNFINVCRDTSLTLAECKSANQWEEEFKKGTLTVPDCIKYCDFLFRLCHIFKQTPSEFKSDQLYFTYNKSIEFNHIHLKTMIQCAQMARAILDQWDTSTDVAIKHAPRIIQLLDHLVTRQIPQWKAPEIKAQDCIESSKLYIQWLFKILRARLQTWTAENMVQKTHEKDLDQSALEEVRVFIAWQFLMAAYEFDDTRRLADKIDLDPIRAMTNQLKRVLRRHMKAVYGILGLDRGKKYHVPDSIKLLGWCKSSRTKLTRLDPFWDFTINKQAECDEVLELLSIDNENHYHFQLDDQRVEIPEQVSVRQVKTEQKQVIHARSRPKTTVMRRTVVMA
jgi:hypothetical protein